MRDFMTIFLDILTPYFSIKQVDHAMHCQLNLLIVAVDVCVAWILRIMVQMDQMYIRTYL